MRSLPALAVLLSLGWASAASAQVVPRCGALAADTQPDRALAILMCSLRDMLGPSDAARFRRAHVVRAGRLDDLSVPLAPGESIWLLCVQMSTSNGFGGRTPWYGLAYSEREHRFLQDGTQCAPYPVLAGSRRR